MMVERSARHQDDGSSPLPLTKVARHQHYQLQIHTNSNRNNSNSNSNKETTTMRRKRRKSCRLLPLPLPLIIMTMLYLVQIVMSQSALVETRSSRSSSSQLRHIRREHHHPHAPVERRAGSSSTPNRKVSSRLVRRRSLSAAAAATSSIEGVPNDQPNQRQQQQPPPATSLSLGQSSLGASVGLSEDSLQMRTKVAAFASRLEQWFHCRRANQLNELHQQQQQQATGSSQTADDSSGRQSSSSSSSAAAALDSRASGQLPAAAAELAQCQAHFDGHLCWPSARLGARVKLPCPRLNWPLVSGGGGGGGHAHLYQHHQQQQQQIRHQNRPQSPAPPAQLQSPELRAVINSIQSHLEQQPSSMFANSSLPLQPPEQLALSPPPPRPPTPSVTNVELAISHDEPPLEAPKYAHRTCGAPKASIGQQQQQQQHKMLELKWETNEADYSECSRHHQTLGSSADSAEFSSSFDPTDQWIKLDEHQFGDPNDRRLFERLTEELDRIEGAIDPYADPDLLEQWTLCIGNIIRQQQQQQQRQQQLGAPAAAAAAHSAQTTASESDLWCPIIFDGWRCWPSTRASEVAYVSCPSNQPGFSAERKAHKICTPDGTWYKHPMTNRYWSNYTTCVDTVDLAFRTKILNLYVIGNLISLVALSASLIIFISFKSLNCTRVTIHKNLFLSFITNNLMWIIWYTCVVNDANLLQSNPIGCQLWHILLHYFLVSNYFWMFCEGLYLHTLLVVAFVSENKILKWFYLLGWLTPIPIIVAYAYNRSYDEYYTNFCWMEESPYNLILMAPIGISLLLNLVFLINIVRVLVTKLRANNSPDTHQTRKAVRATLILIPLLGLHYMLTPFRPEAKSEWEVIYEIVAAVCTSFQGLCVAMLFCFCNAEVMAVIKKKLKDTCNLRQRNRSNNQQMRSRSNTATTGLISPAAGAHLSQFGGGGGPNSGLLACSKSASLSPAAKQQLLRLTGGESISANGAESQIISNSIAHAESISSNPNSRGSNIANNGGQPMNNSRSNGSNSSSLLTTVTASPVYGGSDLSTRTNHHLA